MSKSNIEWTQDTWNPIVGCSILSPGCTHCYAMGMAARIEAINAALVAEGKPAQSPQYDGTTKHVNGHAVWTGKLKLAPDSILLRPLKRKKPTTYFVNSMGDLFHEDVPFEWIRKVFGVMSRCPQHTFQILTKRAARMREVVQRMIDHPSDGVPISPGAVPDLPIRLKRIGSDGAYTVIPLPNVWLGVSTERQQEADERIPLLLQTPAAIRFISAEPLLGPIDLASPQYRGEAGATMHGYLRDATEVDDFRYWATKLDWVIVGGESGPDSRPMHPDWARRLRVQCEAAGVPFFFKQWGAFRPLTDAEKVTACGATLVYRETEIQRGPQNAVYMLQVAKKSAGRSLDGIEYNEMPEVRA
jgi:protein gp37